MADIAADSGGLNMPTEPNFVFVGQESVRKTLSKAITFFLRRQEKGDEQVKDSSERQI